ncbi:hypothetical protein Aduo_014942 [Ancylostoma duodenale]
MVLKDVVQESTSFHPEMPFGGAVDTKPARRGPKPVKFESLARQKAPMTVRVRYQRRKKPFKLAHHKTKHFAEYKRPEAATPTPRKNCTTLANSVVTRLRFDL